jgi:hypothetical protein
LESLWEMPMGYWIASQQFLKDIRKLLGNGQIPAVTQQERRKNCLVAIGKNEAIFPQCSLKHCIYVHINKISKTHWKILKTLSGSSPRYLLSHPTTFNQAQTDSTIPLRASKAY